MHACSNALPHLPTFAPFSVPGKVWRLQPRGPQARGAHQGEAAAAEVSARTNMVVGGVDCGRGRWGCMWAGVVCGCGGWAGSIVGVVSGWVGVVD